MNALPMVGAVRNCCASCRYFDGDVTCTKPAKEQPFSGAITKPTRMLCALYERAFCERCLEDGDEVVADHELDSWGYGSGGGGFVCDNCLTAMGEARDEARLS